MPELDGMMAAALALDVAARTIPLTNAAMVVRPSELAAVGAGWSGAAPSPAELVDALRHLDAADRAPTWELVMRHYGRGKRTAQAAAEIGMDVLHAEALLAQLRPSRTR